ncbi:hypothetical protein ONZ45_g4827 [Pleurotus djamor]|nr:hypothetical protein ONZ45_g4827 [Pleurotus djamor]
MFEANSHHFGFHTSRGLTNDVEYTNSSPSAYTADRGVNSARGKCRRAHQRLRIHLLILICLHYRFGNEFCKGKVPRARKNFSGSQLTKMRTHDERGNASQTLVPVFKILAEAILLVLKRPNAIIPCFRSKPSVYRTRVSCILTGVMTGLTSSLPEKLEFANKHKTLAYDHHIPDFPTYSPLSDQVCEGS